MNSFDASMMTPSSTRVLWQGDSNDMASLASRGKVTSASYRVTEDAIHFASGIVSTKEEILPIWTVKDIDLSQTLTQKARGVADLTLKIDETASSYGQQILVLKSIADGKEVRDLILRQANEIRNFWNTRKHEMEIERNKASASQVISVAPQAVPSENKDSLMAQIERLAEMMQNGLLTAEEFSAAKAKLLAP
jgi:uncharacterized membrane protein YdbT with pleckstrin-like domain